MAAREIVAARARAVDVTPHTAEAAMLLGGMLTVQGDRLGSVRALASGWRGVAVLCWLGMASVDGTPAASPGSSAFARTAIPAWRGRHG